MANWSELPSDLLEVIATRVYVRSIDDYVRFGVVCKPWRSVILRKPTHVPPHVPLIMLTNQSHSRSLYNITNSSIRYMSDINISMINRPLIWGCGHGWLIMADMDGNENVSGVYLVNPITRKEICLPALATLPFINWTSELRDFSAAAISSHPTLDNNGDNCIVMVSLISLVEGKIIFCKLGDRKWTLIENDSKYTFMKPTYCNGSFYAFDIIEQTVVVCDIGPTPGVRPISSLPEFLEECILYCLIESCGELLFVKRRYGRIGTLPGFDIIRLEQDTQKWFEVKSLGNRSLFLGLKGDSLSILASNNPGMKQNCVYFNRGFSCGIFSLDDGSIEYFSAGEECFPNYYVWITPSLW